MSTQAAAAPRFKSRKFGQVARTRGFLLPVEVAASNEGFFIGTFSKGSFVSRESREFFRSAKDATMALARGAWTQRE